MSKSNNARYVSKVDFVKILSRKTGYTQEDIKNVVNAIDDALEDVLCEATEESPIEVMISQRIKITNYYRKPTYRRDPISGELYECSGRFRTKASFFGRLKCVDPIIMSKEED